MRKADPGLRDRRRDAIVEAATGRFLARGFHRTSVADIAAAARISMGLLYRYFANKDAVIAAVAERDRADTLAEIARIAAALALADGLRDFVRGQIEAAAAPGYAALVAEIAAEALRNPAIRALWEREDTAVAAALRDAIAAHPDAAAADPRAIAALAEFALALAEGIAGRLLLPDPPALDDLLAFWTPTLARAPVLD